MSIVTKVECQRRFRHEVTLYHVHPGEICALMSQLQSLLDKTYNEYYIYLNER